MELVIEEIAFITLSICSLQDTPSLADMLARIAAKVPLTSVKCLMLAVAIDFGDCLPLLLLDCPILLYGLICGVEECLVI